MKASLFGDEPEQLTLAEAVPAQAHAAKQAPRRPSRPVPLEDLDDWLDFAESVLGRQDIPADSLASHFTSLTDMAEYEDKLEPTLHGHGPVLPPSRTLPLARHGGEIAAQQGFFHWELRFASGLRRGGFDLQLGNPPWVRPMG